MFKPLLAVLGTGIAVALLGPAAPAQADVNDFSFDSYSADYYLGLDAQHHTTLKTVETLVAEFPSYDQNHGILRAIPDSYDGHPTDVTVQSVTDETGAAREFAAADSDEQEDIDGFYQLVSKADHFVHGKQTYVITYTQHNVTRFFPDQGDDEFYWDTNGTAWDQTFGSVDARVHVSAALAAAYNGTAACYQGEEGSTATCAYKVTHEADGGLLMTAGAKTLTGGENVTVALGFKPGTIVGRDSSFFASPYAIPLVLFFLLGLAVFGWILALRLTRLRDAPGRGIVIAQYTAPPGYDLLTDAVLLDRVDRAAASQIVDLAVRGYLRIIEGPPGMFGRKNFTIELLKTDGLDAQELQFAQIFFDPFQPGTQYTLTKNDQPRGRLVYRLIQSIRAGLVGAGLNKRVGFGIRALTFLSALVTGGLSVLFAFLMVGDARGGAIPILLAIVVVVALLIGLRLQGHRPLTSAGADLRDYLKGFELYINLAEADRLRVLQSPAGADRVAVSTTDPRQLVKLNESVLPYAVLFKLEKEWAREIGKYYDSSTQPTWYSGSAAFNAALFATSFGEFASTTGTSFSGSNISSSSGGSGGGGFSGGGGGGGGGGGV